MGRIASALIRDDIRRSVARKVPALRDGGSDAYNTLQLTDDVISELEDARADRRAVHVLPHKEGGGIPKAVDLLTSVHPMRTGASTGSRPAHSFEIRNINEQIGFQWVMGGEKYQNRLARQLETFYPDSHIEVDELPEPELLPFREGWHLAAARLELKLQGKKERYYPIKHIDVEGFENDPYGSITSEMVGERETETVTNVATQVIFRPAPSDWYKGGVLEPSIHDVADDLEENVQPADTKDIVRGMFKKEGLDLSEVRTQKRGTNKKTTAAADAVRRQAGQKGYEVNIRIVAVGQDPETAISRVDETADMFEGYYDSDTQQGFDCVPMSGEDLLELVQLAMRREYVDHGMTMGVRTAAGVVHVPNDSINTQNVSWTRTSNAGDVPADSPRFSDWQQPAIDWDAPDRSVKRDPSEWSYAIEQSQLTEEEVSEAEDEEQETQAVDEQPDQTQSDSTEAAH
jgi:hypothetical protein